MLSLSLEPEPCPLSDLEHRIAHRVSQDGDEG